MNVYFKSNKSNFALGHGDCIDLMRQIAVTGFKFDMVFADPPYFLSNGGISVQSGKQVSVNKGDWDKSQGIQKDYEFTCHWLETVRSILKPAGTIWISGTYHNIFTVANALQTLEYKILNVITWQKTNPPPNLSCRYFTYSTEFIIWARKEQKVPHPFNYELMKYINDGQQMKDVWLMPAIGIWEKEFGKHPTQKPISLLVRIILSCTQKKQWILDPFTGSSTTGIAANLLERNFFGIDQNQSFLDLSIKRYQDIQFPEKREEIKRRIPDIQKTELSPLLFKDIPSTDVDNKEFNQSLFF